MIAAAITGSALIALYAWQDQPAQNSAAPALVRAASPVFGPGALPAPGISDAISTFPNNNGLSPPGGLAVTENGELVVNIALLDVIDFFLLEQSDGDRASTLKLYLKSKLPDPAYHEAEQIVDHYQTYMKEYDSLLAVQNFGAQRTATIRSDISRIATWSEQRNRLRQSILGENLVQAWYQNDDAQLQQVLGELQQHNDAAVSLQGQAPSSINATPLPTIVPRWSNAGDEAHHNAYMQDVLAKATRSFSASAEERRQWSIPYTAFVDAANRVDREAQVDRSKRNFQIQKLLNQYFHTEAEKELAHDRWEGMHGSIN